MSEIFYWQITTFVFAIITFFVGLVLGTKGEKKEPENSGVVLIPPEPPRPEIVVMAPPDPRVDELASLIRSMPTKVLETVQSATNQQKGKLGELVGYLHLNAQYDRLIVLKDITDFVGIRFPKDDDPGTIDFIDIKNGQHARLTKEQTMVKKLAEDRRVGFKRFKIETDGTAAVSSSEG